MKESWDSINNAIDTLLDSNMPYSVRRKELLKLSEWERDEVIDYAKRYSELDPQASNRLIEDIYALEI